MLLTFLFLQIKTDNFTFLGFKNEYLSYANLICSHAVETTDDVCERPSMDPHEPDLSNLLRTAPYRSDLSSGVGVLSCQTKVQHVALPVCRGKASHSKVGLHTQTLV